MSILNRVVEKNKVILLVLIIANISGMAMAQKTNLMMFLPENSGEFVDLKKFGVKETYDKPHTYDNKEFKTHSPESNASSVTYEFVIFTSESECANNRNIMEGGLVFMDRQRFKGMGLSVLKGDPYAVFNSDFNILISDRIASAYFGNDDPINKILILDGKYSVMIKGVYKSKENSLPMEFDFIGGPVTNEKINRY